MKYSYNKKRITPAVVRKISPAPGRVGETTGPNLSSRQIIMLKSTQTMLASLIIICLLLITVMSLLTSRASLVERLFIFSPSRTLDLLPSQVGLACREIFLPTAGGLRLHAWYAPPPPGAPVVLHCHGNGGNISHRLGLMAALQDLGLGVFLFDYQGYGLSQGVPSEAGIYEDARTAYRYLVEELQPPRFRPGP